MTMTCSERLEAAIQLRKPDRVPVVLHLSIVAARWAGMTTREYIFDTEKAEAALDRAFVDLGGWDAIFSNYFHNNARSRIGSMYVTKFPGEGIPEDSDLQMLEVEAMRQEDYPLLLEMGAEKFIEMIWCRNHPGMGIEALRDAQNFALQMVRREKEHYSSLVVPAFMGGSFADPFNTLLSMRSFERFLIDLYRIPEMVERAEEVLVEWSIARGRELARTSGIPRIWMSGSRHSYVSPRLFERFALPYWKRILAELSREGIVTLFVIGADYTLRLPQLRSLPRASCILGLDHQTDIFEAKRILGGSQCIMGNVPGTMLIYDEPQKVTEYCQKLIKIVGEGGGFILSTTVGMPLEAKKENVRAMIEAAKTCGVC